MVQPEWKPYHFLQYPDDLTQDWVEWILYAGSFMRHLKEAGVHDAKVQVVEQAWRIPDFEEADCLQIEPRRNALIREVLIASGHRVWMYAKTVIPRATLTGPEKRLAQLGNRAIGSLLFKKKSTLRSPFELAQIFSDAPLYQYIAALTPLSANYVWGRRSQFFINQKRLLLTEIFLPAMEKIIGSGE